MNAETGEPEDTVTSDTLQWMNSIGSQSKTISDVINTRDPLVSPIFSLLITRKRFS